MIDPQEVDAIFKKCLFRESEIGKDGKPRGIEPIKVEGIMATFHFHPDRIEKHRDKIMEFLKEMPEGFSKGGGWSFLNLCNTKNGELWTGMHSIMEQLVCLGIAIEKVSYCLPREVWSALPGGMPYIQIKV